MNYELKHFDTTLIRFSATEDSNTPEIHILWQNDEQKNLFPLDLDLSGDGISKWLIHRTIPKNRAYEALEQYADTLLPCVYDDFVLSAKKVLTPAHKEGLWHLLNFKFKKHSRYNLPPNRLKLIEKQIHRRAKELLE